MTTLPSLNQHPLHQYPLHQHHHQILPGVRNPAAQPTEKMEKYAQIPLEVCSFFHISYLCIVGNFHLNTSIMVDALSVVYLCYFSVHVYIGKRSITEKWIPSHQFRQRRQSDSYKDSHVKRSVLFVLDTSGSIGKQTFQRMTAALSSLTPFFCKPVQFALMTFNERRWLEFCFNCFDNTLAGRVAAKEAIENTVYRSVGSGATHSGEAVRCACNELINIQKCGLFQSSCIDVVFITDGYSNGPLDVCEEVKCLHNNQFRTINTYAIGINNYREAEIKCIANYSSSETVFSFESFIQFEEYINNITTALTDPVNFGKYNCTHRNQDQNPTLSP